MRVRVPHVIASVRSLLNRCVSQVLATLASSVRLVACMRVLIVLQRILEGENASGTIPGGAKPPSDIMI